jgi:hypothetical protein
MSGSSRNSDRRSDNAYPKEKPKPRTLRERAAQAFDDISDALNPRTYLDKPAARVRDNARNTLTIGGERRRREIEAATGEPRSVSEGRPRSGDGRRSRR